MRVKQTCDHALVETEPGRAGRVVLAATPLGNIGDASPRLVELLRTADIVAAEDTRRLRRLTSALGIEIAGRVVSYFEGNEKDRARELIDEAVGGACIAVVTDAGALDQRPPLRAAKLAGPFNHAIGALNRFNRNHIALHRKNLRDSIRSQPKQRIKFAS